MNGLGGLEWFTMKFLTYSDCGVAAITKLFIFWHFIWKVHKKHKHCACSRVKAARSSHAGNTAFLCLKTRRGKSSLNTNLLIPK